MEPVRLTLDCRPTCSSATPVSRCTSSRQTAYVGRAVPRLHRAQVLAAGGMSGTDLVRAAAASLSRFGAQLIDKLGYRRGRGIFAADVQSRLNDRHQVFSAKSSRPISMRRISLVPAPIS